MAAAPSSSQSQSAGGRSARLSRQQSVLLALLVLSICINYIDRGSLSVGQSYIRKDLGIDSAQLGLIFSSFFWTYATLQIVSGLLVDRWPVKYVYGAGYALWSLAMLATGLVQGLLPLQALRLVLGAGESVAYPAYSRILASSFREEQRGLANGLIDAGSKVGPAIGVLVGGLAMEHWGWRSFFVGMGALSMLWLIPWARFAPRPSASVRASSYEHSPSLIRILRQRSAWGTFIGLMCSNYAWYFMVFWIPPYLVNERHFSQHDMSILGSAPFWGVAFVSMMCGWLADRAISSGLSPNRVRKFAVSTGLLLPTLMLPAMLVKNNLLSLALLTLACASFGLFASNVWAITQTLAGPSAAGKWSGLQNAIGNIPGMVGLWFTGWVIHETGRYLMAFAIACLFLVAGALSFLVIVERVEPVNWAGRR